VIGIGNSVRRKLVLLLALAGSFMALSSVAPPAAHALGEYPNTLWLDIQGHGTLLATSGVQCGVSCSHQYPADTILVNVAADPDPGWEFAGWVAGGQPDNQFCIGSTVPVCQVIFQASYAYVNARFVQQPSLTVSVAGSGSGTVSGTGISCPGDCHESFGSGSSVTLTATPGPLSAFSGWSGACSGSGTTCHVTMSQSRNVTATFGADIQFVKRTLTVGLAGAGSGTVSSGSAIACPGDCSQEYQVAGQVTLTATPAAGSVFAGWSGDCSGTAATCQVTMSVSRNVTATFEPAPVADPGQPDPGQPDPGQPDPGQPDPGQPDPGQPDPGQPDPGQPDPGQPGGSETPQGCTITGTAGDDVLTGTPGDDVICGLGGKDTLVGGKGNDVLLGGEGADTLLGGAGKDVLKGGAGSDELVGGKGNDRLTGGAGRDHLAGAGGSDTLLARDDKGDLVDGGAGRDRARVDRKKDTRAAVESVF
jgi:hypothetical protein